MAATCLIRLHRYPEAVKLLEHVLQVSPQNFKAMYNLSFCRRAEGYQKDAIENLTKVPTCFCVFVAFDVCACCCLRCVVLTFDAVCRSSR